ncbi:MAG: hemolysin III family protein [Spirochaetaceae bacterium]|nr:MAG: hemolysin III family protein [Spirochaetaceae bacterium]
MQSSKRPQSFRLREELANSLTHGAGALIAIGGSTLLIIRAATSAGALEVVTVSVFGAALVLLYTSSTLYHAIQSQGAKQRLKLLDHLAIYLLIAGTYTPFTLLGLGGAWGWSIFGVVWGLALPGVLFKVFFVGRFKRLSTAIYIGMGWVVIIAVVPLLQALRPLTLLWLLAGGLSYTAGTAFYLSRRLPFGHSIWHLFVLGGSVCHYFGIWTLL